MNESCVETMRAQTQEVASRLKLIANPHRLMILCHIGEGESHVNNLVKTLELSQPAVSQHLAVLRERGLLGRRRDGQKLYYYIKDKQVLHVTRFLCDNHC